MPGGNPAQRTSLPVPMQAFARSRAQIGRAAERVEVHRPGEQSAGIDATGGGVGGERSAPGLACNFTYVSHPEVGAFPIPSLWKDADPDIPIYKQVKAEYAKP
jgi:hypothetical protein